MRPALQYYIGSFDAEVLAWRNAVVANKGSVSSTRLAIISAFVRAEKTSGAWALTDDYWPLWAENAAQALTSLKQRRLVTAVNSPTFTADRGYVFDGLTSYLNSNFVPSTHGIAYKTTDQRIAIYERTNLSNAGFSAGVTVTTSNRLTMRVLNAGAMSGTLNNNAGSVSFTLGVADSRGLKVISRAGGGTTAKGYDRGIALTDSTGLTVGANIQNIALFLGAHNNAGTPANFRASSLGFAAIGGPLSDAQEAAQYASVQAFATAVGAAV